MEVNTSKSTSIFPKCLFFIFLLPTLLLMLSVMNRSEAPVASPVTDGPTQEGVENSTVEGGGCQNTISGCQESQRPRPRLRRTLAFPDGSKASLRINFKYVLFPNSIWLAYANGFRAAWDLPKNASNALPFSRSFQRRELFRDVEDIMEYHGMDGRSCILRGLCEASRTVITDGGVVRRILHLLFTVPEEEEHHMEEYSPTEGKWKRSAEEDHECEDLFPSCPFSILDAASLQFT